MSLFSNNYALFEKRFPQLAKMIPRNEAYAKANEAFSLCQILQAKNGATTAKFDGKALHSLYDPEKEAQKIAQNVSVANGTCVFLGWALGYVCIEMAMQHPSQKIIVIESDLPFAFLPFLTTDLTALFNHPNLILLFGLAHEEVIGFFESQNIASFEVVQNQAATFHNEEWFSQMQVLLERNKTKQQINENTAKKYWRLWDNNAHKNYEKAKNIPGIIELKDLYKKKPCIIIAAGPTLFQLLPAIKSFAKKCVVVCVDTALKIVQQNGIEADFTLVMDCQYWALRHLDFTSTEKTTLISEISVHPGVFLKKWKAIYLCASFYPTGKKLERGKERGSLVAGGSVATSAWDFARFIGCTQIYFAGLDLGFPNFETHVKGSTFESWALQKSDRLNTADTNSCATLFGAQTETSKNYNGEKICTDSRMKMYAWWFESHIAQHPEIHTFSLSSKSLCIPGVSVAQL